MQFPLIMFDKTVKSLYLTTFKKGKQEQNNVINEIKYKQRENKCNGHRITLYIFGMYKINPHSQLAISLKFTQKVQI